MKITRDSGNEDAANTSELGEVQASAESTGSATEQNAPEEYDASETLEILAEAERNYLDRQSVSFAIRLNDAHLFSGPDRDEDGFVRLMLRESYHDFVLPGSDEEHHVVFEPRLLLHESGVAQIDLVLRAEASLNVRQVLAMMWGPQPVFVRSQMSKPLLRGTSWQKLADFSDGELDAGAPLGLIEHEPPVSMSQMLDVHLSAVLGTIRKRYDRWLIYPVTMLDPEDCCAQGKWQLAHRDDLIRLAMRGSVDREIAPHVPVPVDLSLGNDHSLHANMGSAVYFQWSGPLPNGIGELDTVLVLEYALLQYMRLAKMEERVSRLALSERKLRSRYGEAIRLFSELRQRDLRAGEARDIVRQVLDAMGAAEMRRIVEAALNLSASAYATFSAERASRRAWWIAIAATVVALVVAVPSISEILRSVPAYRSDEVWVLSPLRWLAGQGFFGPWIAMTGLVALIAIPWIATLFWRWRPARRASRRRGYKWPTEFRVTADDRGPVASGAGITTLEANLGGGANIDARKEESRDGREDANAS